MLTRNTSFAKFACALAALCLFAASACTTKPKVTGTLTKPQVTALLQKWDDAQMSRDLEGITACLSPRLQYKKTYQGIGPTETETGDYSQYMKETKNGLGVEGENISTSRKINDIGVNTDGQTAAVSSEAHDLFTIEGNRYRALTSGTMTVGLDDGRAVITGIDEVVIIDAEGR